jgi:hypothetical protein
VVVDRAIPEFFVVYEFVELGDVAEDLGDAERSEI